MIDKSIEEFCKNYDCKILNEGQYQYRPKYDYFAFPNDASIIQQTNVFEKEKVLTIQLSERRFKTLIEIERRFYNCNPHGRHEIDIFENFMLKLQREKYFRESNPAVKKAYENYSLMLHLIGYENSEHTVQD